MEIEREPESELFDDDNHGIVNNDEFRRNSTFFPSINREIEMEQEQENENEMEQEQENEVEMNNNSMDSQENMEISRLNESETAENPSTSSPDDVDDFHHIQNEREIKDDIEIGEYGGSDNDGTRTDKVIQFLENAIRLGIDEMVEAKMDIIRESDDNQNGWRGNERLNNSITNTVNAAMNIIRDAIMSPAMTLKKNVLIEKQENLEIDVAAYQTVTAGLISEEQLQNIRVGKKGWKEVNVESLEFFADVFF